MLSSLSVKGKSARRYQPQCAVLSFVAIDKAIYSASSDKRVSTVHGTTFTVAVERESVCLVMIACTQCTFQLTHSILLDRLCCVVPSLRLNVSVSLGVLYLLLFSFGFVSVLWWPADAIGLQSALHSRRVGREWPVYDAAAGQHC